jgi:hypothetical protein
MYVYIQQSMMAREEAGFEWVDMIGTGKIDSIGSPVLILPILPEDQRKRTPSRVPKSGGIAMIRDL